MPDITVLILTYNEELHIRRCIENVSMVAKKVYVIDSFSQDRTVEIAKECGAIILQHKYVNQAQQFQWALENCRVDTVWTMRMDADEYLSDELIDEIQKKMTTLRPEVTGVNFIRNVKFLNHTIRYGTLHPVRILRMWRTGKAYMEQRWMDEHMILTEGEAVTFKHRFYDENLNGLTEWTQKHNNYSNREILVELDKKYSFFEEGESSKLKGRNRQKSTYYKLPKFFRAFLYFFIRYVFYLGFLDGISGLVWLTLQSYWYRFLVDAKLKEIEVRLGKNPDRQAVVDYIRYYYHIDLK